jgi:hypothetical protein
MAAEQAFFTSRVEGDFHNASLSQHGIITFSKEKYAA